MFLFILILGGNMKTLLLLAKGVEMMEMSVFVDVFGWARSDFGMDTQIVTCGFNKQVISTFNIPLTVDYNNR